jgi:hypothetical protein
MPRMFKLKVRSLSLLPLLGLLALSTVVGCGGGTTTKDASSSNDAKDGAADTAKPDTGGAAETAPETTPDAGTTMDVAADMAADVPAADVAADVAAMDVKAETGGDTATEVKPEAGGDTAAEAKPEAAVEAGMETFTPDALPDAPDAGVDAAAEAGTDAAADAAVEAPLDAAPETVAMCGKIRCDCTLNGKRLYGRVQIVTSALADFDIRESMFFPDLRVQDTDFAPNSCGKWQFVTSLPDFTVRIVPSLPDFEIKYDDFNPGVAKQPGQP